MTTRLHKRLSAMEKRWNYALVFSYRSDDGPRLVGPFTDPYVAGAYARSLGVVVEYEVRRMSPAPRNVSPPADVSPAVHEGTPPGVAPAGTNTEQDATATAGLAGVAPPGATTGHSR